MNNFNSTTIQFMRLPAVLKATGRSKTSLWTDQQRGLFPKPVKIGGELTRAAHYLSNEVNAVLAARAAQQSDEKVRALIESLKIQRKVLLSETLKYLNKETD